jgi:hypothetical protein
MPRKKGEKTNKDKIHETIRDGLPTHVADRRYKKSALADDLKLTAWNRAACPQTGETVECEDPDAGRRKANQVRADASLAKAMEVLERYGERLDSRRLTKHIAELEGFDARTVRRWRGKMRKNGQA